MKKIFYSMIVGLCLSTTVTAQNVTKDPRPGFTEVSSIRELKQLEPNTEARLTLIYDTVMFVSNSDMYVRDGASGCYAINFKNMGLDLKQGMVIFGSIVGKYMKADGKSIFTATENTTDKYFTVTCTTDYLMPFIDFDNEDNYNHVDDVVTTGEVIIDSLADASGTTRLYASQSNGARVMLTDKYGYGGQSIQVPAKCTNISGILSSSSNGENELYMLTDISTIAEPLAVTRPQKDDASADATRYNLAGQKVSATYKGVVLSRSGKKWIAR